MSPLTDTALRDAHAVLFPAITDLRPTAWLDAALAAGTRAVVPARTARSTWPAG